MKKNTVKKKGQKKKKKKTRSVTRWAHWMGDGLC